MCSALISLLSSIITIQSPNTVDAIPLPDDPDGDLGEIQDSPQASAEFHEPCETVNSIVASAFFMNVGQQERGASDYLLLQSYRVALGKLIGYVKENYPNSKLGDVCLTAAERSSGVYQNATINNTTRFLAQPSERQEISSEQLSSNSRRVNQSPLSRIGSFHPNVSEDSEFSSQFGLPQGFEEVINSSSVTLQEEVYNYMGVQNSVNNVADLVSYKDSINLFYFPLYLLPEEDIPALEGAKKTDVLNMWESILLEMQKPSDMISVDDIGVLPPTVEVFFDPFDESVQQNFSILSLPSSQISGDQLLYSTSAIMLRAALAGVDEEKCLSLLTHTAAYLFNAIRSSRVEGRSIQLFPTFLPVYDEAFRRWTSEMDLSNAPIVEPYMVDAVYHDDLEPLLYFNASGNVNYVVRTENGTWAPVNLSQKLFDSSKLEELRQMAFAHSSDWRTIRTTFNLGWAHSSRNTNDSQNEPNCPFGYVPFINPSVQPQSPEEECCAAICEDLEMILTVGLTSMSECCVLCNLATCYVGDVDTLNDLVAIRIEQYGLLEERVISVTI